MQHRPIPPLVLALFVGCGPTANDSASETSTSDDATSSSTDTAGSNDSDTGSTTEDESEESDSFDGPILDDWDQPPETETEDDGDELVTTDGDESNTSEMPACCYCVEAYEWLCFGWNGGEETCLDWGGEDLQTSYDPDCPEAWTDDPDDDVACEVVCV